MKINSCDFRCIQLKNDCGKATPCLFRGLFIRAEHICLFVCVCLGEFESLLKFSWLILLLDFERSVDSVQ